MLAGLALLVACGAAHAAIAFVAASTNTANASSISLSSPAGTSTGDLLLAVVASRGGTSVSAPSGWSAALTPQTVDAGVLTVAVFYRVRAASDAASFSFSLSSSERVAGTMLAFSGVDSTAPVLNALGTVAGASTSSPSATGFSTTVANAMLVAVFAQSQGSNTMTPPTGMAEASDIGTGAGPTGATLESAYVLQANAAPTGSKAASSSGSARSVAALIALRPTVSISGNVFEDPNYGGGAGRSKATALAGGGSARPNTRVELFSVSAGSATYSAATTTDASGNYSFTVSSASSWAVRVVSSSVLASRTGATAALLPVLTARSEWNTNAAWQVSDHVGGINPALGDAAAASAGAVFNTSTGVFSAGPSGTAQAFSLVVPGATAPSGVDFGFNFATVVNVGDSGAGSLRQVLTNANALGADASLAVSGRAAAIEHVIFMIGNGTSGAGLRASVNLFSSGVAVIAPTSALPAVSAALVLDARTQPGWASTPVLELRGTSAGAGVAAFTLSSSGSTVAGWAIKSFGGAGVVVTGAVSGNAVLGNHISGNTGLGIDLANNGLSANDGAKSSGQPNVLMDAPVITTASVSGSTLTLSGHVGSAAGQSLFAGSRVEFFLSDNHVSGYGAGSSYLGTLTSDASGNFSGTLALAAGSVSVGDRVTATATDASGNTSEFGANRITTTAAGLTPAGFEAFDADTATSATVGPLRTRVAGAPTSVDVVALAASGGGLHPGFTGTVSLRWLDARNDSGAASGSCRASWPQLGSAGNANFAGTSRVSVTLTPPATSTRVMRLMLSYTSGSDSVTACSGDAFAVIPASLSLAVSDLTSASAGTARALSNASASGGVVHQAGRPFSVTATARDAAGNVMTGYDGTPALAVTGCVLPAGCTASSLSMTPSSAVAGAYANHSLSYGEVGAITLRLSDSSYADIDALDTAAAARAINSSTATAGRFVPDSLSVSINPTPLLATANAACMASGSGATFFGQGFGWASAPQVTVRARNAAGSTTLYWSGSLMKLVAAHATPTMAASGAGSATLTSSFGALSVADLGAGQARISASSLDRFVLDMAAGTVQASLSPSLAWTLSVNDSSESGVAGNPSLSASATQSALGFDAGAMFHSGRLALSPGHGDARVGVRLLLELQRYASAGWVTMTEDRGCVTVVPANLGVELPSGVFATLSACAAPLGSAVSTRGGRAWLPLPATPSAAPGRLGLRLAGAAAAGNSCGGLNSLQALTPLNLPWLISGSGPLALASWGRANRETVLRREVW